MRPLTKSLERTRAGHVSCRCGCAGPPTSLSSDVGMTIRWQLGVLVLVALSCTGCVVPIPHPRVHAYGVAGQVVSAADNCPIIGASVRSVHYPQLNVRTNPEGTFRLPAKYGWHGAYFIGPICLSLFPGYDMTPPSTRIDVSAPGYQSAQFTIGRRLSEGPDMMPPQRDRHYLQSGPLILVPLAGTETGANHAVEPTRAPEGARGSP